ncbi:MAG: formate dehydrogenase family accessory protein FdhD [SAR116 cluster bacterium]|jgi:FdhD protein|nr:formate dehydrogenase family accessory protein FdhD [SAR116 cluster bacterium]|tara:strand:- start:505 stop:1383 length:879 start_codon:yes stop_codon:yes gene_type:complete
MNILKEFAIKPNLKNDNLTEKITSYDENGNETILPVVKEVALTIFLNKEEIVTVMTLGDMPELLALGYLLNQNMIKKNDEISSIDYDDELKVVIVRTSKITKFETKLKKKIRTSGCAVGTIYGDLMEDFNAINLNKNAKLKTSWLYQLSKKINTCPSLYLKAGALHGCVLCKEDVPLAYVEDVGRHNAVDKIAGWMMLNKIMPDDKIFYTTGRLTSEMVIKTVIMGIPILVSRSGFTESGVTLAKEADLTLVGRAKGKRMIIAHGKERIIFDVDVKNLNLHDTKSAQQKILE